MQLQYRALHYIVHRAVKMYIIHCANRHVCQAVAVQLLIMLHYGQYIVYAVASDSTPDSAKINDYSSWL